MLQSFTSTGVQFAWDSTSIKLAEECHRKYQYRMIEGWQPRRKSTHLLFGGWYASALEHFHKFRALGDTHDEALRKVVREALIATWEYDKCSNCGGTGRHALRDGELDLESSAYPGTTSLEFDCAVCSTDGIARDENGEKLGRPWQSDHSTKTRENLIRTIIWYLDHFQDESTQTVIMSDGRPAVELSFSFEVDHDIWLAGHLDRLVSYAGDNYVMDQKTSGSTITSYYFDQFDLDTQMSLYTFAGQVIYQLPVKGVIIDAAQVAAGSTRFARGFSFRDPERLAEWYETTLDTIKRAQDATAAGKFLMNTASCNKFAGCEFRGVCSRSPSVRENFLQADFYRGERWDPLKRR